jgi:putative transposase
VLNRSVRRITLFRRPLDYRAFLDVLAEGLARHPVRLVSYCVMPNHFHLVVGPTDPKSVSRLMHWVSTTHAKRWHTHRRTIGQGPVYQGRFKGVAVQDSGELTRVCRYVERNALRAGLVRRAQDWPWCSLAERLQPTPSLPLVTAPFLEHDGWIAYVNAALTAEERLAATPGSGRAKTVGKKPVPLDDVPEAPGVLVGGVEGGQHGAGGGGGDDQNQADAHVERPKHLVLVQATGLLQPRNEWRHRPTAAVE